jgi:hypothetical protein
MQQYDCHGEKQQQQKEKPHKKKTTKKTQLNIWIRYLQIALF